MKIIDIVELKTYNKNEGKYNIIKNETKNLLALSVSGLVFSSCSVFAMKSSYSQNRAICFVSGEELIVKSIDLQRDGAVKGFVGIINSLPKKR